MGVPRLACFVAVVVIVSIRRSLNTFSGKYAMSVSAQSARVTNPPRTFLGCTTSPYDPHPSATPPAQSTSSIASAQSLVFATLNKLNRLGDQSEL
jgi:hypothetical protein